MIGSSLAQQRSSCGTRSCLAGSSRQNGSRVLLRTAPRVGSSSNSSNSRARTVQVQAKGKGKKMQAPTAPMGEMVKPQIPPLDDNEQFCIFTRAKTGNYQNWIFVSVVNGGSTATAMVKGLSTEWGRTLYTRSVMSSIGQAVYKDRDTIVSNLKQQIKQAIANSQMAPGARVMEPITNQPVAAFEFAFKIRDRTKPGDFQKAEGLTILPSEAQLSQLPIQQLQKFFSPETLQQLFQGSSS